MRALCHGQVSQDFYPRPPRGGRLGTITRGTSCKYFYPRPPRGGRLPGWDAWGDEIEISIHALREEGDPVPGCSSPGQKEFLSTPSARRATKDGKSRRHPHQDFYPRPPRGGRHKTLPRHRRRWQFLSTPSARRATWLFDGLSEPFHISIHALREEGDLVHLRLLHCCLISIHALREEGDEALWRPF